MDDVNYKELFQLNSMEKKQIITKRINQLIKIHGTIRKTSKIIGIDNGYLSYLRSGKKENPSHSILKKLELI